VSGSTKLPQNVECQPIDFTGSSFRHAPLYSIRESFFFWFLIEE